MACLPCRHRLARCGGQRCGAWRIRASCVRVVPALRASCSGRAQEAHHEHTNTRFSTCLRGHCRICPCHTQCQCRRPRRGHSPTHGRGHRVAPATKRRHCTGRDHRDHPRRSRTQPGTRPDQCAWPTGRHRRLAHRRAGPGIDDFSARRQFQPDPDFDRWGAGCCHRLGAVRPGAFATRAGRTHRNRARPACSVMGLGCDRRRHPYFHAQARRPVGATHRRPLWPRRNQLQHGLAGQRQRPGGDCRLPSF